MHVDMFLQQFGHLANSDGGIKKLRQLVLQLAVRGKLVAQDAGDEPAAVLLKRIEVEKKRLVREGKCKKSEYLEHVLPHKENFYAVSNWAYKAIESVWYTLTPLHKIKSSDFLKEGDYPIVDQGQSHIAGYTNVAAAVIKIPHAIVVFGDHTKAIKYIDFDFCPGADGTKIIVPIVIDPRFFYTYLCSLNLDDRGYGRHFKILKQQTIPIPPLAEQKRIVTKVDELMAVCDALEAAQNKQRTLKQQAVAATLHHLTSPATPADGGTALTILTRQFPQWFDDRSTLKTLRAHILDLAFQGKLALQNFNEKPPIDEIKAISSLKKISADYYAVDTDLTTHKLPSNWVCVKFTDVITLLNYGTSKKCEYDSGDIPVYRIPNIKNGCIDQRDLKYASFEVSEIKNLALIENDILIIRSNGSLELVGQPAVIKRQDIHALYAGYLIRIRVPQKILNADFLVKQLTTSALRARIESYARSTSGVNNINSRQIASLDIMIPPLAEQHRIVAKVDELMTLCDKLETQLTTTQTLNTALMDALLHHLCAGADNTLHNKDAA